MSDIGPIERSLSSRALSLSDIVEDAPQRNQPVHKTAPLQASVLEAVETALLGGETHYTVRPGMPELRRHILEEIAGRGGPRHESIDQAVITTGESESLYVALLELISQSGTVLVAGEGHQALFRFMELQAQKFTEDPQDAAMIRMVYREAGSERAVQEALVDYAGRHQIPDILNLGRSLHWGGGFEFPPFTLEGTIVIGDLGFRLPIGYLAGPERYLRRIRIWKQAVSICSAAPSQRAALTSLAGKREEVGE
jgi:DNA-binding transcriptional MocR family regulator